MITIDRSHENQALGEVNLFTGNTEVIKMRGNFWKVCGFASQSRCYLLPEESLLLFERGQIIIECNDVRIQASQLYDITMKFISIPCYLAFSKLKTMEYLVFRYGKSVHSFASDSEIIDACQRNTCKTSPLLASCISYKAYIRTQQWSKKMMNDIDPIAYVLVLTGDYIPDGMLLSQLLEECGNSALLIAQVSPSGNVMMQEFTDANRTLDLVNNDFLFSADDKITTDDVTAAHIVKQKKRKSAKSLENINKRLKGGTNFVLEAVNLRVDDSIISSTSTLVGESQNLDSKCVDAVIGIVGAAEDIQL